jgi:hypothetical protein
MKTPRTFTAACACLLAAFAVLALTFTAGAQELPVATPVGPDQVQSEHGGTVWVKADSTSAPGLPAPALLIAVVVPLLIAGLKKLFPKIPGAVLPVLAPVLGGLLEALLTSLGHDAGGLVTGAVSGSAGTGLREIVDQNRKRTVPPVAVLGFLCGLLFLAPGCTSFHVEQGDVSPEREITFRLSGRAWGSGQQVIAQLKALQTDKSQSFGVDSVSNKGPTNAVAVIEATTKLLNAAKP